MTTIATTDSGNAALASIPKLTGSTSTLTSNYFAYKFRLTRLLTERKLMGVVDGSEPKPKDPDASDKDKEAAAKKAVADWEEKDNKAFTIISLTIKDDQIGHIQGCRTAKEAWDKLSAVHEGIGVAGKMILRQRLASSRMEEGKRLQEHIDYFKGIASQMKSLGDTITDEELVNWLFISLPPSYEPLIMALQSMDSSNLTFDYVSTRLIQEETRRAARNHTSQEMSSSSGTETALSTTASGRFGQGNGRRNTGGSGKGRNGGERNNGYKGQGGSRKMPGKCHYCGIQGHWKRDCNKRKRDQTSGSNNMKDQTELAFTAHTIALFSDNGENSERQLARNLRDSWNVDSGATHHITANRHWFIPSSIQQLEPPIKIVLGDGSQVTAKEKGTINWALSDSKDIRIEDVLFVQNFAVNLLSVRRLANKGIDTVFSKDGYSFRKSDGKLIWKGTMGRYGFYMDGHAITTAFGNSDYGFGLASTDRHNNEFQKLLETWHKRLGHLGITQLRLMVKQRLAMGLENLEKHLNSDSFKTLTSLECGICNKAKGHRTAFPEHAPKTGRHILDLIHADICGPIRPVSAGGKRYFLPFIDDASRRAEVYLLKSKSSAEVLDCFKRFKQKVELATGRKIRILRTDGGGEFCSQEFEKFLDNNGIQHQKTTPYTPQQNGIAERFNRTIMEAVRAMLFDAGNDLPVSFWGDALITATYIRNRVITSVHGKTPFEVWEGKVPDLRHFQPFGIKADVIIPETQRTGGKLGSRTECCIFIGYGDIFGTKAYRFYNPRTRKVICNRNARFLYVNNNNMASIPQVNTDSEEGIIVLEDSQDVPYISTVTQPTEDTTGLGNNSEEEDSGINDNNLIDSQLLHETQDVTRNTVQQHGPISRNKQPANKSVSADIDPSHILEGRTRRQHNLKQQLSHNDSDIPGSFIAFTAEEPRTLKDIEELDAREQEKWKLAMKEEMDAHTANGTWTFDIGTVKGRNIIGSRWVFKIKADGRYKARLVAQGFTQQPGIDYSETFAPVVKFPSFRALLSLTAYQMQQYPGLDFEIHQMDFKTAYLNSSLNETIFMRLPDGRIVRLLKALYGLKQSGREWYLNIDRKLRQLGFQRARSDYGVYLGKNGIIIILYVDDILIRCTKGNPAIKELKKILSAEFSIEDMGDLLSTGGTYLGIEISRIGTVVIRIQQTRYIKDILQRFGMHNSKPVATPIESGIQLSASDSENEKPTVDKTEYQAAVGSLMYAMLGTRPDLAYAVGLVSQFASNPSQQHWKAVKRIFRYLRGTTDFGITYGETPHGLKQPELIGYSDADWASSHDRKSTGGFIFGLGGTLLNGAITWSSKRQSTVALSSTESEYMAVTQAVKEALWLQRLFGELTNTTPAVHIRVDNQGAIALSKNPKFHARTKHIDIQHHFVREVLEADRGIQLEYCPTEEMVADVLTKGLARVKHEKFTKMMGVC